MINFIKLYYPIIIIIAISLITGGFIERELISQRYNNEMSKHNPNFGSNKDLELKQNIIYGNCNDCY